MSKSKKMIPKQEKKFIKDALFISYTGLKDFTKCPRSFYLKNIYRDPETGYKIQIASPYLTLGSIVHDVAKWYLQMGGLVTKEQLEGKYRNLWLKYRGKKGGFATREDEASFGKRGLLMLDNFFTNAGKLELSLKTDDFLKFQLDEKIILNGRLDFLGQLPDGTLHIIDFKTGSKDEEDTLQLYIYAILAESNFQKKVSKISYWYLDRDSSPKEAVLDSLEDKIDWLKNKTKEIESLIKAKNWVCIKTPELCRDCQDYQDVIAGKGEFQFIDEAFKKQIFYLDRSLG